MRKSLAIILDDLVVGHFHGQWVGNWVYYHHYNATEPEIKLYREISTNERVFSWIKACLWSIYCICSMLNRLNHYRMGEGGGALIMIKHTQCSACFDKILWPLKESYFIFA